MAFFKLVTNGSNDDYGALHMLSVGGSWFSANNVVYT